MRIFTDKDAYNFQKFPKISARKKQFKENKGGQEQVCDLVENYAKECAEEEAKKSAQRFFENGVSYEVVRASITSLSDEELESIYKKVKGME